MLLAAVACVAVGSGISIEYINRFHGVAAQRCHGTAECHETAE
jgi:hypothetical protein